jgi:hypothetical protein
MQELDIWNICFKAMSRAECHRDINNSETKHFQTCVGYKLFLLSTDEEVIPEVMPCIFNTLFKYEYIHIGYMELSTTREAT